MGEVVSSSHALQSIVHHRERSNGCKLKRLKVYRVSNGWGWHSYCALTRPCSCWGNTFGWTSLSNHMVHWKPIVKKGSLLSRLFYYTGYHTVKAPLYAFFLSTLAFFFRLQNACSFSCPCTFDIHWCASCDSLTRLPSFLVHLLKRLGSLGTRLLWIIHTITNTVY